jgi:hypothetical protein
MVSIKHARCSGKGFFFGMNLGGPMSHKMHEDAMETGGVAHSRHNYHWDTTPVLVGLQGSLALLAAYPWGRFQPQHFSFRPDRYHRAR